jgi:hypothetical protein
MPLTRESSYTIQQAEEDIATLRGQIEVLNEVHTLGSAAAGPVPNAVADAVQVYTSTSQVPSWVGPTGLSMGMMGAQPVFFPGNTVTQATLHNLASGTYIGGDATAGSMYEMEAWGTGQQGSSTQTLEFAVVWAGTTMTNTTFGTTAMPANQTFRWWARARAICHTAGSSGTWSSFVLAIINGTNNVSPGNGNMGCASSCENATTSTVNDTVNQTLSLQAAWGATTGAPTLTSQVAYFRRLC